MKKRYIFTLIATVQIAVACCQVDSTKFKNSEKSIDDVIEISLKSNVQNKLENEDVEKGFFNVKKIDELSDFYLIFIEKDDVVRTIYSEKSIECKGVEIETGSVFYFELSCKDTLNNGKCVPTIPDVTYFGKYKGYELGKLKISKNLCALFLIKEPNKK